jgi:hypothetical protein
MKEAILRDFFAGKVSVEGLAKDVQGAIKQVSAVDGYVLIEDMDTQWTLTPPMLVSLCDAVLDGKLPAESLHQIGFMLVASDHFDWDEDDLMSNVIHDWSCPEVNYPLNEQNVARFKKWLLKEEPYPPKPGIEKAHSDKQRIVSRLEKRRKKP